MHPAARCLRLRRPPTLVVAPGRFVPERVSIDEVDEAWSRACARNARLFDGPVWHVTGVSRNGHGGVSVHVIESSYRFHAVRTQGLETGLRGLGVKGITWRGGRVLLGRRSLEVHDYPGAWEFIPGGTLVPGRDPRAEIERELHEEAAWRCVRPPIEIGLIFDDVALAWDIVLRIEGEPIGGAASSAAWEVDALEEIPPEGLGSRPLSPAARLLLRLLPADARAQPSAEESGP